MTVSGMQMATRVVILQMKVVRMLVVWSGISQVFFLKKNKIIIIKYTHTHTLQMPE